MVGRHLRSGARRAACGAPARCAIPIRATASRGNGAARQWLFLDEPLIWQGTEEEALSSCGARGLPLQLSPAWRVLLLSDGSVTRHLQLLTGLNVHVDCFEMEQLRNNGSTGSAADNPQAARLIGESLVRRQVYLQPPGGSAPLVYACSWWNANTVDRYLRDRSKPIWVSLSAERTELFRDIQTCYYGGNAQLERAFESEGPFLGRQYVFWHQQQPLTVIHEVFSTALQRYLGPMLGCEEGTGTAAAATQQAGMSAGA